MGDPMIVTATDGTLLVVWLAAVGKKDPSLRWFAALEPDVSFNVAGYRGEDTPEAIRELICEWWARVAASGPPRTAEELRPALAASPDEDATGYVFVGGPADGEPFELKPGFA